MTSSRNAQATRSAILRSAQDEFAAVGYERATIRGIATKAAIDPAMVMRYYGSKEELFARAVEMDLQLPDLRTVRRTQLGRTIVQLLLDRWGASDALAVMMRAAMTNEVAAGRLESVFTDQVEVMIAAVVPADEVVDRAALVATQLVGLAVLRFVVRLEPVAQMDQAAIVARIGPTIQRYLTAPLAAG